MCEGFADGGERAFLSPPGRGEPPGPARSLTPQTHAVNKAISDLRMAKVSKPI